MKLDRVGSSAGTDEAERSTAARRESDSAATGAGDAVHPRRVRILLVEDNPGDARLVIELLRDGDATGYEITQAGRLSEATESLRHMQVDVVLLDLGLPDSSGLATLSAVLEAAPEAAVVVLTGLWDEGLAAEAVRSGAEEYLVKGEIDGRLVVRSLRYALERKRRENEQRQSERELLLLHELALALGESQDLESALRLVLEDVCRTTGWATGEAWLLNRDGTHLGRGPVFHRPGSDLERFHEASLGFTFAPGEGLPGRAWSSGGPIWSTDVSEDPAFRRAELAGEAGLRAAMVIPVKARDEVAAVLAFYNTRAREQDERLVHVIATAAAQLGTLVQRRQTEQALRRSETRLRRLMDTAYEGIWALDARDRTEYVNTRLAEMLGYAREEMIGRPIHEFLVEPMGHESISRLERRRRGESGMAEIHLARKDGSELWALTTATPIRDEEGHLTGSLVMLNDITARKEAEAAERLLARAGEVFSASLALHETLAGIADVIVPQLAEGCILSVHGREERDPGILEVRVPDPAQESRLREIFGREPIAAAPPETLSLEAAPGGFTEPHWSSPPPNGPIAHRCADRARELLHELEATACLQVPLKLRGDAIGTLTLIQFRAEGGFPEARRALAEELGRRAALAIENSRLYEQASRAIRARDEVLGVVAHDLRNPLNAISMTVSLLLTTALDEKKKEARLNAVLRSVEQMDRLIQDLLDVTRIEAGRLRVDLEPIQLSFVLAELGDMVSSRAAERGLSLEIEPADGVPRVLADRERILQVLSNLVGNAVKFTPAGGTISVRAVPKGADSVLISVSDTGVGIDPNQIPHLFDRFWQARSSHRGGAGLGLAIAKGLVEAHGGTLWVSSEPGRGSTFTFDLPTTTT